MDLLTIEKLSDLILVHSYNILIALAIFIVGKWFAKRLTELFIKLLKMRKTIDETFINFFDDILYYILLFVVALAALDQLGIDTTSLLTILGAAGLAIGLALKDSLSNFASGVLLVFLKPFKIDDVVTAGGITGVVQEIDLFNTKFVTFDNQKVLVPNSSITSGNIININALEKRRVDLTIGIGYDDDLKKAKEVLQKIIQSEDRILKDEPVLVAVSNLGDSSVDFIIRVWTKTDDYWDVKFALTEDIKLIFDKENISIPYPQTDVHLHKKE